MKRTAEVYQNADLAGFLSKTEEGNYLFVYSNEYFTDATKQAISLNLPKTQKTYQSESLFPFFANLIAEGANKKLQCRHLQIDERDDFSLLLATANYDTIGAITLKPLKG